MHCSMFCCLNQLQWTATAASVDNRKEKSAGPTGRGRGRHAVLPAWKTQMKQPAPLTSSRLKAVSEKEEAVPPPKATSGVAQQKAGRREMRPRPTVGKDQMKICKHGRVKKVCPNCPDSNMYAVEWDKERKEMNERVARGKAMDAQRAVNKRKAAEMKEAQPPKKRATAADMFQADEARLTSSSAPPEQTKSTRKPKPTATALLLTSTLREASPCRQLPHRALSCRNSFSNSGPSLPHDSNAAGVTLTPPRPCP